MNIYHNLTPDEVRPVALIANEEGETLRPTSYLDKVKIMQQQFNGCFGGEMGSAFLDKIHMMFNAIVNLLRSFIADFSGSLKVFLILHEEFNCSFC